MSTQGKSSTNMFQQSDNLQQSGYLQNMMSSSQNCSKIIISMFSISLLIIATLAMSSHSNRINFVEGPVTQHLPIYSGEIHYSRIPWQYWEHRIQMVKALGFNSISVYVMWNYHQVKKGVFDFQSPQKNLTRFLELASLNDMKVLFRPGPYVCAEWDFGGLPARLLNVKGLQIRTNNSLYEKQVKIYFQELSDIIRPFLFKNKGNIIMIQIQNQLGSLNSDIQHTLNLVEMWKQLNIECQFYIQDASWNWHKHYWPGAHVGLSQGKTVKQYNQIDMSSNRSASSLVFGGQIYTGWLTHWGEKMNGRPTDQFIKHFYTLLKANRSISLFVAHGGTNFGLTAGANGFPNNDYMPHITSYDYDAPINEQGQPTIKYYATRNTMKKHLNKALPPVPKPIETILIKPFRPKIVQAYLFANLPQPSLVDSSLTYYQSKQLQMYNQGMVLYETILPRKGYYQFNITFRDYLLVYIDDTFHGTLSRKKIPYQILNVYCPKKNCTLRLLNEAMGHINYGIMQKTDRKGIISFNETGGKRSVPENQYKWKIYKVPIDENLLTWTNKDTPITFPALIRGQFQLQHTGDTYIDMSSYQKGYVWVNGNLLGRYWRAGPQTRLFCPGVWLHKGVNTIKILQLLSDNIYNVAGVQENFNQKCALPECDN